MRSTEGDCVRKINSTPGQSMSKRYASVLSACITLATALEQGRSFATDNSDATEVYGFVIGSTFTLPHCKTQWTSSMWLHIRELCWIDLTPHSKAKVADGEISVFFPKDKWPAMSKSSDIGVTVLEGKLAGLVIETSGVKDIDTVFPQLVAKFGNPTTKEAGILQNGFGARFPSIIATWKRGDVTITYDSHPYEELDDGHVTIYTPEAAQLRANGGKKRSTRQYTPL